jgi:hypothetical protein
MSSKHAHWLRLWRATAAFAVAVPLLFGSAGLGCGGSSSGSRTAADGDDDDGGGASGAHDPNDVAGEDRGDPEPADHDIEVPPAP